MTFLHFSKKKKGGMIVKQTKIYISKYSKSFCIIQGTVVDRQVLHVILSEKGAGRPPHIPDNVHM